MKKLFPFAVLLVFAAFFLCGMGGGNDRRPMFMSVTTSGGGVVSGSVVQSTANVYASAVDPGTATFNSAVTSGNTIVVLGGNTGEGLPAAPTDNKGNTYTAAISSGDASNRFGIWYSTNVIGGSSFKVTFDAAGTTAQWAVAALELTGTITSSNPYDIAVASSATTTKSSTKSLTPAQNAIIVGGMTHQGSGSPALTLAPGWTSIVNSNNTALVPFVVGYLITPSASSMTVTIGSSVKWVSGAADFKCN